MAPTPELKTSFIISVYYFYHQRSVFLINSTCRPVILNLQQVDMYKNLEKGQEWSFHCLDKSKHMYPVMSH